MVGPYQDPTIDELNKVAAQNPMPGLQPGPRYATPPAPTKTPDPTKGVWQQFKESFQSPSLNPQDSPGFGNDPLGLRQGAITAGHALGSEFPAFFGDDGNGIGNRLAKWWAGEPSGQKIPAPASPPSGAAPGTSGQGGGSGRSDANSWTAGSFMTPGGWRGPSTTGAGGEPPRKSGQVMATVGGKNYDYTGTGTDVAAGNYTDQQPGRLPGPLAPGPSVTAFDPMYGQARTVGRPGGGTARPGLTMESGSFESRPYRDQTPAQAQVSMENAARGGQLIGAQQQERYLGSDPARRMLFQAQLQKLGDPKNAAIQEVGRLYDEAQQMGQAAVQAVHQRWAADPKSKPVNPDDMQKAEEAAFTAATKFQLERAGRIADIGAGRYPGMPGVQ